MDVVTPYKQLNPWKGWFQLFGWVERMHVETHGNIRNGRRAGHSRLVLVRVYDEVRRVLYITPYGRVGHGCQICEHITGLLAEPVERSRRREHATKLEREAKHNRGCSSHAHT